MKQIAYNILALCFVLTVASQLGAQTGCDRNFTATTSVGESTCMANGTITVTLTGDVSNIIESSTEYALRPVDGTEGTSKQFATNNILADVAAGIYIVSIRTYCKLNPQEVGVVTEVANVVVPGSYKPLMASTDLSRMRGSYTNCATGLIAFNVQNGTGYGIRKYYLTKAPAGIATGIPAGEVFPVVSATTVTGYVAYELPGFYPPGEYQIDIVDGCSTATILFTLGTVTILPTPSASFSSFAPKGSGQSCSEIKWTPGGVSNNETTRQNYTYQHFVAGLYEIALMPSGQTPQASDWQTWTSATLTYTLPGQYRDYFGSGSLVAYIRVKDCNLHSNSINTYLKTPPLYNVAGRGYCDHFKYYGTIYNHDYDGFWCFPLAIEVTNNATGQVVHTETYAPSNSSPSSVLHTLELGYDSTYSYKITDASGLIRSGSAYGTTFTPNVSFSSTKAYYCSTFKTSLIISFPASYWYCYPTVDIYKENEQGEYELYNTVGMTSTTTTSLGLEYPYGKYKLVATFPRKTSDGTDNPYTPAHTIETVSPMTPTTVTLTSYTSTSSPYGGISFQNWGLLRISGNATFPVGTQVTVTQAPEGYTHLGRTFTSTSSSSILYIGSSTASILTSYNTYHTYMPTGNYEVSINTGCGDPIIASATLNTGFNAENVKFKIEEDGCFGGRLMLDLDEGGYITYQGTAYAAHTNFRIIDGPNGGYEEGMKTSTQYISLSADGEYIIGIIPSSSSNMTYLEDKLTIIRYTRSKPTLNPSVTSAYVCTDPGSFVGYIMFTGQGGQSPYSYRLLNSDGTPAMYEDATPVTATGGNGDRIVFNYGGAGQSYIIEITDACGNSTTQSVQLADLNQQAIVYKIPAESDYCTGDTLKLNCITLGQTSYLWEKRNADGVTWDSISNAQNPRIYPATEAHNGTYRVTVTPEYCGDPIMDTLNVVVQPLLVAGTATGGGQEVCAGAAISAVGCSATGGRGIHRYQWQRSTDQSTWANITGATSATYTPAHRSSGRYYYRLSVTDDCTTVYSEAQVINVKACYIMVNPNLRHRVVR